MYQHKVDAVSPLRARRRRNVAPETPLSMTTQRKGHWHWAVRSGVCGVPVVPLSLYTWWLWRGSGMGTTSRSAVAHQAFWIDSIARFRLFFSILTSYFHLMARG